MNEKKTYPLEERPLAMLHAALQGGESRNTIARKLACSRTAVSLLLSGQYPARTDKMATLIIEKFGRVHCPFLEAEISGTQCKEHREAEAPTSSPLAMRHWRTCQGCEHNPKRQA